MDGARMRRAPSPGDQEAAKYMFYGGMWHAMLL